ncbi:hypothetical protein V6N11_036141 [Hibiscus sabdariffa]|uniref:RNase H type-1 domain-containing protein n=1 Tax=Hibiscus sabdariffa TaxID=183260 RepID=A0ABR2R9G8_9ROSI
MDLYCSAKGSFCIFGSLGDSCIPSISKVWLFIPFAVIWTFWLFRNDIVFNAKWLDWLQLEFLVKFCLGSWLKTKFDHCPCWIPPPCGYAKLNVDEVVLNFNAKGGIGGVLRGTRGEILFQFSELCGLGPPALIELIAIKVGMLKFLESEWCDKFRLIIECDCKLVVDWLSMSATPPISFSSLVYELLRTIRERGMSVR